MALIRTPGKPAGETGCRPWRQAAIPLILLLLVPLAGLAALEAEDAPEPVQLVAAVASPTPAQVLSDPDSLLLEADPALPDLAVRSLPLPKAPAGPAVLHQARAVQVTVSLIDPARSEAGTVVARPVAALRPENTTPAAKPAAAPRTEARAESKTPAAAPLASAPSGAAPAASAPVKPAAVKPAASPRPAVAAGQTVKPPVPIQRSSAPVLSQVSAAATQAASLPPVADPHKLPEYQQVQLPPPAPAPAPPTSLPLASQEISGTQGQTITVRLNGRGWMFTGTGKTPAGVSFMEKLVQNDAEQFRFRLDEAGHLGLQFQRQDVASGLMERQVASLTVLQRGAAAKGPSVNVAAAGGGDAGQYQPEFPVYQEKNLVRPAGPAPAPASVPARAAEPVLAAAAVEEALPNDPAGLLAAARKREQALQVTAAIDLYERILKDFPAFGGTDEVLFRLARQLESAGEQRNLRRSYELYVRLQAEYDYSGFVEAAKERARYINRTYFRQ